MLSLPLMREAAAACKTNEIGAPEWSGGKQHLGRTLALFLLPNLTQTFRFSSLSKSQHGEGHEIGDIQA